MKSLKILLILIAVVLDKLGFRRWPIVRHHSRLGPFRIHGGLQPVRRRSVRTVAEVEHDIAKWEDDIRVMKAQGVSDDHESMVYTRELIERYKSGLSMLKAKEASHKR